jgi:hypothetical protein
MPNLYKPIRTKRMTMGGIYGMVNLQCGAAGFVLTFADLGLGSCLLSLIRPGRWSLCQACRAPLQEGFSNA